MRLHKFPCRRTVKFMALKHEEMCANKNWMNQGSGSRFCRFYARFNVSVCGVKGCRRQSHRQTLLFLLWDCPRLDDCILLHTLFELLSFFYFRWLRLFRLAINACDSAKIFQFVENHFSPGLLVSLSVACDLSSSQMIYFNRWNEVHCRAARRNFVRFGCTIGKVSHKRQK